MAKGNSPKLNRVQRQTRLYRILIIAFSMIIVLTMVLSLVK